MTNEKTQATKIVPTDEELSIIEAERTTGDIYELAELLNVAPRTIRDLTARGFLNGPVKGQYKLVREAQLYIGYLRSDRGRNM